MKFAKDIKNRDELKEVSELLIRALPWIKDITGKTIVIKYGGAAMVDEQLRSAVMADIVLLKIVGVNPVIVHGGGNAINDMLQKLNMPVEFKDGLRVTDEGTMDIVKMVLMGEVNQELVEAMNQHGNLAVGVSGGDAGTVWADQLDPALGRVGVVSRIDTTYLEDLILDDYIPVVASLALGEDGGYCNVNADLVAGELAAAIGAQKCIFLTDVDGLYLDFEDKGSLISKMTLVEMKEMIAKNQVSKGMIPKLKASIKALEAGVPRTHIINGTMPHSLILELLTDFCIGTLMYDEEDRSDFDAYPLGNLASKLTENLVVGEEG